MSLPCRMWRYACYAICFGAWLYLALIFMSLGGAVSLKWDILSHFRMHYLVAGLLLLILSICCRGKKSIIVIICGLLINLAMMLWALMPVQANKIIENRQDSVKIYAANVLFKNENYDVLKMLKTSDYDHILLLETDFDWVMPSAILKETYPYYLEQPRQYGMGLLFFSKHEFPLEKQVFQSQLTGIDLPYIWADFGDYIFVGIHAATPLRGTAGMRNEQMDMLAKRIQVYPDRKFIVMGDFNDTLWSFSFQRFLKKTKLRPTSYAMRATWPIWGLPIGIQIDHALVKGFDQTVFDIEKPNGSDHLPIRLQIQKNR